MGDKRATNEEEMVLKRIFQDRNYSFQEGFSDRLMQRIEFEEEAGRAAGDPIDPVIFILFRWIALGTGIAVLILLLLINSEGSLLEGGLYGLKNMSLSDAITFNIDGYAE